MQLLKSLTLLIFLFSQAAAAAQVKFAGRAYSGTGCGYYSTSLADLHISYENLTLPWYTEVRLRYGFKNSFTGQLWQNQGELRMDALSPYTWATALNQIVIDTRGSFAFSEFQFVFLIRLPNGEIIWDNGGLSPLGFYQVHLPERSCEPGKFEVLPSRIIY